jgi:hypothetical protein
MARWQIILAEAWVQLQGGAGQAVLGEGPYFTDALVEAATAWQLLHQDGVSDWRELLLTAWVIEGDRVAWHTGPCDWHDFIRGAGGAPPARPLSR